MKGLIKAWWSTSPMLAVAVGVSGMIWVESLICTFKKDAEGAIGRDLVILGVMVVGYGADYLWRKQRDNI